MYPLPQEKPAQEGVKAPKCRSLWSLPDQIQELGTCSPAWSDPASHSEQETESPVPPSSLTVIDWLCTLLKIKVCLGTLFWPSPVHSPAFITKGLEINTIHLPGENAHHLEVSQNLECRRTHTSPPSSSWEHPVS